jgi:hypothetical protein
MDPQVPTSFIPKKPLVGETSARGAMGGLLTLGAILLFFVSLLSAAGAFAYGQYLDRAIASKDDSLKKAEGAFSTRAIQELERLDMRLIQAQELLQGHVAPSGIFTFLSATTLERVQFTSLSLDVASDGSAKLSMEGLADSFSTLALQSDKFSEEKVLRDVIFSGITTNAAGRVVFSFSANVDSSVLSFANTMPGAVSAAAQGAQEAP